MSQKIPVYQQSNNSNSPRADFDVLELDDFEEEAMEKFYLKNRKSRFINRGASIRTQEKRPLSKKLISSF